MALLALFGAQGALAQQFGPPAPGEPIITTIQVPNLPLGVVTFPNGKAMNLTVALGSGAFRAVADAPGKIWLVTDRGPAIACADAKRLIGMEPEAACSGSKEGSLYPLPGFVPSIYGVEIGADLSARITAVLPLKGKSGRPASGRPTPSSLGPKPEPVFSADGKPLPVDASGANPEALVRLSDGSFWLADAFGPSLIELGPDGAMRRRLVPGGSNEDYKDSDAEIVPSLPAILRMRRSGQGFRALALSPDEQFLYAATALPLAVPDEAAAKGSRVLRLAKIERASGTVVGQYLYMLDGVDQFGGESPEPRMRGANEVKLVEMAAAGTDKLLVLEQVDKAFRFSLVTLDEASRIPPDFDMADAKPSLETLDEAGMAARALVPLIKTPVVASDRISGLPARIEAFAIVSPNEIVAINDNDFGVDGARTQMFRILLPNRSMDIGRDEKSRSGERK